MEHGCFHRAKAEPQLGATVVDLDDVIFLIARNFPVLVPDMEAIGRRAGFVAVAAHAGVAGNAAIDSLAESKLLGANVRQGEMRHVKLVEERRLFTIFLAVAQAEAKKRHLITVAPATLGFQVAGVVPPLGFEIGVGIVIGRKNQLSPGQGELVGEPGSEYTDSDQSNDARA